MIIDLHDELNEIAGEPFAYGRTDCCMFAARLVRAFSGKDYASKYDYSTLRGALRILKSHGGVEGLVTELMGPHKPIGEAVTGDVVIFDKGRIPAVGVVVGAFAVFKNERTVVQVPLSYFDKAWSP